MNNDFYKYYSFRIACVPPIPNTVPIWPIRGAKFKNSEGNEHTGLN